MSLVNKEKYVSSLPGALKNSTIYFVKQGSAFDLYVTNETGTPVVYGLRNTLLTGNAGGQIIIGGTGAGENLTLVSTSDPSKGKIYLGVTQQNYFDGVTNNLVIQGSITSSNLVLYKGELTKSQRDVIVNPKVGTQIFQTDDGWFEYYDAFFGWMPLYESNEWKAKYGTNWHDLLASALTAFIGRTSGTGAVVDFNGTTFGAYLGSTRLATGSTATGYATLHTQSGGNSPGYYLGKGIISYTFFAAITQLSNATDEYVFIGGFTGNNVVSAAQTDGILFTYDRTGVNNGTTAQTVWQCVTRNATNSFVTPTSVTVASQVPIKFNIRINAAANTVWFYINDNLVATHTSNIPATTSQRLQMGIFKSAGTFSSSINIWDAMFKEKFYNPR